jgi:hypothetical protein
LPARQVMQSERMYSYSSSILSGAWQWGEGWTKEAKMLIMGIANPILT